MSDVKEYEIVKSGRAFKMKWAGGGQVPQALEGDWTDIKTLTAAIERYEDTKPSSRKAQRGVKNGNEQS